MMTARTQKVLTSQIRKPQKSRLRRQLQKLPPFLILAIGLIYTGNLSAQPLEQPANSLIASSRPILELIELDPTLSEDLKLAISAGYELKLMTTDRDFWKLHYNKAESKIIELKERAQSWQWQKWLWFVAGVVVASGCIALSMWGLGQVSR